MKKRLIDADALDFEFDRRCFSEEDENYIRGVDEAIGVVKNAPTINPDDLVKHGEWETCSDRPDRLICSVCDCGFDMWKHDRHNYCPNCGAKMDGGKRGNV